ncbi:MAG: DUF739 family protein [Selenomonas sp.]|nr:DUF739 family protein [Selenomonas sp.]
MSFNYAKLKGRIVEKYGSQAAFSKALGVSERTLSLKINNKIFFTQGEIKRASELLGIDMSNIDMYFFAQDVQKTEQAV